MLRVPQLRPKLHVVEQHVFANVICLLLSGNGAQHAPLYGAAKQSLDNVRAFVSCYGVVYLFFLLTSIARTLQVLVGAWGTSSLQ